MKELWGYLAASIAFLFLVLAATDAKAFEEGDSVDGYTTLVYTGSDYGWVYQQATTETELVYPRLADICGDASSVFRAQIVHFESGTVFKDKNDWAFGEKLTAVFSRSGHYFLRWQCVEGGDWFSSIDATAAPRANWYFAWLQPPGSGTIGE